MDHPGQLAAKRVLADKILSPSVSDELDSGLSTTKMVRNSTKFGHPESAVFDPGERAALNDTRRVAQTANRASMSGADAPRNGIQTLPWLVRGMGIVAPTAGTYAALSSYDESLTPGQKAALSIAVPAGAVLSARGANAYSKSALGKASHFLDPELKGVSGALQRLFRGAVQGSAAPLVEEEKHYMLGNRP